MAGMSKGNQRQGKAHEKGYKRYIGEERLLKNKARRVLNHIKRYPWDAKARDLFSKFADHIRRGLGGMPDLAPSPVKLRKDAGITLTAIQRRDYAYPMGG